ncbi:Cd(II)/Pb(II)-responsive transcriptional regulator [Desulfovibrio piger]|uniref:Cd(II)/Pb(II)-responsive transcriptional regulator n=1 Tax=Desulfovibrio piger TaxID=901 RepID=UPI0026F188C4|nr:Cd(II)/Pb(II)-responsive transcriptional regulator [Desulfovibrio piger]
MKVKIGELAKMTGCQVVTIRYYEKEGLLKRPERTERNYRLYGEEDMARLRFIRHCRQHGMSLDEIRTLLVYSDHPTGSCEWINALIRKHIEAVEQQIRDLEHLKAHLESLYHTCDGSREGGCGILKSLIDGGNCLYCQARQAGASLSPAGPSFGPSAFGREEKNGADQPLVRPVILVPGCPA